MGAATFSLIIASLAASAPLVQWTPGAYYSGDPSPPSPSVVGHERLSTLVSAGHGESSTLLGVVHGESSTLLGAVHGESTLVAGHRHSLGCKTRPETFFPTVR